MQSSGCSSQPPKARRFEASRPTNNGAGRKSNAPSLQKEDKNKNTIRTPASRQAAIKGPAAPTRTRTAVQPRVPLSQPKFRAQKQGTTISKTVKPKPKGAKATAAGQKAPATPPSPPLPNNLPLDPNCNEPSLPCLCCDGRSPQDHNSMFNHNHNNNNTISLRQQMQLPPPPAPLPQRADGPGAQGPPPSKAQNQLEQIRCPSDNVENQKKVDERDHPGDKENIKVEDDDDDEESSGDIDIDDDDDSDDEDEDTLVPSCCDCPPSLLEFSLSSSTSSSSTSISSCSDMESDCLDPPASICSSQDQESLCTALSPEDSVSHLPDCQPPARSLPSLPLGRNSFSRMSCSASSLSSPDEGYPSALDTPSPDYLGIKGGSEVKMGLLDFLESVGEFGKMERFSQIIQVARWDLDSEQQWDVLRDRLDHLDCLEKVNREVKLAYFARLHEKGFDLEELEEQDLSDVMDEMGNIEIPWKFYKSHKGTMGDSQEFSDAGVDLTAPSDCDDHLLPDSLSPSPVEPPPKPPVRHASVSSDLHTYINISRETTSMAVTTSPTLSTFSPNSTSPTFTTFRCERPLTPSPPSIPPLPAAKPVPYLTLYTTPSPPPSLPTPTPPIPPPRRRHLARKEAQRLAALQAEQQRTPLSLPPPTSRPPPLPPPPVISVSSSSPPAIPPPPALPPPPSFHALDVEIRKLLMLAGLTQAELLKLSPELGVCVDGLEDEGVAHTASGSLATQGFRLQSEHDENGPHTLFSERDGQKDKPESKNSTETTEEEGIKHESKESQRITSFTEMAQRRKKNPALNSDTYFSTSFSHTHEAETKKINFDTFHYPTVVPDSPPPPPPPRPLPPVPSSVSLPKVSTLLANSKQPERFDWLIAFTPECEALPQLPPVEKRKSHSEAPKKLNTSSPPPGTAPLPESAPKVTTFKELRFRNKSGSPPTKVITAPEPDPTVITPDPDILYNLKWRKEKECSDGIQWEYTSQAQALFMQPPPALTSMAALQEMLKRAEVEGRQPELCPQKIGSSVSDSSLWTMGRERPGGEIRREEREQEKEEVRGRADGGRTLKLRTAAVRSVSFAGLVQDKQCMGEDVRHPVRAPSLSPLCLQEKRALVSSVSVAVEAIVAQFSSSRTVVQKTLSGDSTINPSLGRLVLQCLCPALHSLLTDGLKPHQSDLIAGRRPNSPWGLVQASTRPGPKTQLLFNLQVRVSELPQLRQNKHRFNAFLLGLLNSKLLDSWLLHLQSCSDVLDSFYLPTSFMRLSLSTCKPLFEELLLVLQPLSLLTFNLDLLFQHHHLEPDSHVPEVPSPISQGSRLKLSAQAPQAKIPVNQSIETLAEANYDRPSPSAAKETTFNPKNEDTSTLTDSSTAPLKVLATVERTSPQLLWVQEKEMVGLLPPNIEEESFAQQAGQVFQQGWGAVMRWGGRLSHNLSELSLSPVKKEDLKADQPDSDYSPVVSGAAVPWDWGRLFGATKSPISPTGHIPTTRRPSQWLAPGVTALTRMVSSSSTPTLSRPFEPQGESEAESGKEKQEMEDKPQPLRSVRTLCNHTGTGSELSFCKGEELVVLGGVNQDWIRCRQGDKEGLVPIGYTSLIM